MPRSRFNPDSELARLQAAKASPAHTGQLLGADMIAFFKRAVSHRQTKLTKLAEYWAVLVPEALNEHCCIESLHRGTVMVIVDSSSHLYELKQLLLAGLEQQILLACRGAGLKKISLKLGQWYEQDEDNQRKPMF